MRTRRRLAIIPSILALLAACDSTEPEPPSLAGTWTGPTIVDGVTTNWTLEITSDAGGALAGTIAFQDEGVPVSYNADLTEGTYSHPTVSFSFALQPRPDRPNISFRYQGSANADRDEITGNLTATVGDERMSAPLNFARKGGMSP